MTGSCGESLLCSTANEALVQQELEAQGCSPFPKARGALHICHDDTDLLGN